MRGCGGDEEAPIPAPEPPAIGSSRAANPPKERLMLPRGLIALFLAGATVLAVLLELLLARAVKRGSLERPEIRMSITINAPIARVWEIAADVQRQPEWMHEMKRVEMITPGAIRVGSRGRATVRIFGISTTDDVVITRLEPPHAFGIRHEGRFTGEGLLLFSATPEGGHADQLDGVLAATALRNNRRIRAAPNPRSNLPLRPAPPEATRRGGRVETG